MANPIVIVPAGHRGVLTTFGKVEPLVLAEGLHFRVPVAQQVVLMNVQIQKGEGGDVAASRDLQHVDVKVALNYRLDAARVPEVYQQIGTLDAVGERIILPAVHEAVKAAVAQFTAEDLVTRRNDVRARIREQLDARLRARGVIVEDFAIVAFSFSKQFAAAIEDKSRAEQQRLKAERDLERIRVEAEQQLTRSRADAQALTLQRKAEAESLALQRAQITPELLQWEAIRRWDGKLPDVVSGGATPLQLPLPLAAPPAPAASAPRS
jgi:regulator of protease activity HflC (stomatin/prohibitin superfamily)